MFSLNPCRASLSHMGMLLASEVGELLSPIKGWIYYGKRLDQANVVEELGDIEFALAGIRQILGITREETLEGNIKKLSKRYSEGVYSDRAAIERADKEGGEG